MEASPMRIGTLLALLAAICFGVVTPFIQRFGAGIGPFVTAVALYLGAAIGALPLPSRLAAARAEPAVGRRNLPRLLLVALFGAALAPTLFAWGLQRMSAASASLLLNLEAVFTLALAAVIHREPLGSRVLLAAALMTAGGAVAVVWGASDGLAGGGVLGPIAVAAAVLCWALDNVLARPLADLNPAGVVRAKALLGLVFTGAAAVAWREQVPAIAPVLGLVVCGATGYGVSLRLYLMAQRRIGAGRTGSIFAVGPFVGAAVAALLGERVAGSSTLVAGALFAAGVVLHVTERHAHRHVHEAVEHEHAHRHDDGHHDHVHEVAPVGMHSHPHRHEPSEHAHGHGLDLHHQHH